MYELNWTRADFRRYLASTQGVTEFAASVEQDTATKRWVLQMTTCGLPLSKASQHESSRDAKYAAGLAFYAVESGAR